MSRDGWCTRGADWSQWLMIVTIYRIWLNLNWDWLRQLLAWRRWRSVRLCLLESGSSNCTNTETRQVIFLHLNIDEWYRALTLRSQAAQQLLYGQHLCCAINSIHCEFWKRWWLNLKSSKALQTETQLSCSKWTGRWSSGVPCWVHVGERLRLDQAALRLWDQLHVVLGLKFWQRFSIFGESAVDKLFTMLHQQAARCSRQTFVLFTHFCTFSSCPPSPTPLTAVAPQSDSHFNVVHE